MNKYEGKSCPICKKQFDESDDVVVCPDCGTPHHRDCYANSGACAFEGRHDAMREEAQRKEEQAKQEEQVNQQSINSAICSQCNMNNPADALFCSHCGAALHGDQQQAPPNQNGANTPFNQFFGSPYAGMKPDDMIGDISVKEFAAFIGPKSNYYLPRFKAFSENKPISFNLAAFFLTPFYFLYRKMISYGIINLIINLANIVLVIIWNFNDTQSFLSDSLSNIVYYTYNIMWYLLMVVSMISCFFGNWLYYKKAIKTIKECKEKTRGNSQEYLSLLSKKGSVSMTYVGICLLVFSMISIISFYLNMFLFYTL